MDNRSGKSQTDSVTYRKPRSFDLLLCFKVTFLRSPANKCVSLTFFCFWLLLFSQLKETCVSHRKCESVWQPHQADGRWDPKVSPQFGTPSTSTIAPLGVFWGCSPAPIAAGPSVGSLELPHSNLLPDGVEASLRGGCGARVLGAGGPRAAMARGASLSQQGK